ncbi:bifunctional demethylmenaquinone methyltransferase/2-methoxy-6-polyprenyl-1,4-benzoquinol methylase UbiE [Cytophagaceae bacterium ABcell3]|nr:bifunctional demethylmenaquinone methyltransferase/2-methoxy-6-polyprenyl-1,4-benzoquinol methylase UbiE [Cytophagaceae bacterium ABcell3]
MTVTPYKDSTEGKKVQVARMFDNISHKYDFLNHFLSLGIDKGWRKKAIKMLSHEKPETILDVATGTGDFSVAALKSGAKHITGVDISAGMLEVGRKKVEKAGLTDKISFQQADSEQLPFEDNTFDAIIVAFGVRNFENLEKGLSEFYRVLKSNGTVMVLELSMPTNSILRGLFSLYFKRILPLIGKLVSRDNAAYSYLPESVENFPSGEAFLDKLTGIGFKSSKCTTLTFGISSIYTAKK